MLSIGTSPAGGVSVLLIMVVLLGALVYTVLLMVSFRRRSPLATGKLNRGVDVEADREVRQFDPITREPLPLTTLPDYSKSIYDVDLEAGAFVDDKPTGVICEPADTTACRTSYGSP